MFLKKIVGDLKASFKSAYGALPDEEYCDTCAASALEFCIRLYGKPIDPEKSYRLTTSIKPSRSTCAYFLGFYIIALNPRLETREARCAVIGHEMYHRVTMKRPGLRSEPWIDEMMAFVTSCRFLEQQGFQDYAKAVRGHYVKHAGKVDLKVLREFRYSASPLPHKTGSQEFPENFYEDVARLGIALCCITDSASLCRIVIADMLEKWIDSLPQETQYFVCRTLELAADDKPVPNDQKLLGRFFSALYSKGDREGAIEEFQKIVGLQPENGVAFYYLGRAYMDLNQFEAALEAYFKAKTLGYSDKRLLYNIGSVHWQQEIYTSASEWFQKAVEQTPDWAQAHYFLGRSLIKMGDLLNARAAWKKVLTLDDEHHKKLAQKALEDYPFGDTS